MVTVSAMAATKKFTLCIDAGHGGHDAGAVGTMSKEKNLTLKHALAFGRMVEQNCPDVKVVYTRTTDRFVELWQRAEIANKAKADLFLSIHINALPKGKIARGYQTYALGRSRRNGNRQGYIENLEVAKRENAVILYEKDYQQHYEGFDPNSPESNIIFELMQDKNMENSVRLAKLMQKYVCQATGRQNQGVHQDNLAVLRLTSMPACLLELGFISTPDEERYMNSDAAVYAYARGIYNAFMAYRNRQPEIKVPFESVPQESQGAPGAPGSPSSQSSPSSPSTPSSPSSQSTPSSQSAPSSQSTPSIPSDAIVFKVQILTTDRLLKAGSSQLKGRKDAEYYREKGLYKYTIGAFADFASANRLRRELNAQFPGCFVIAFRGTEKVDVNQARDAVRK
jgi:N-acetylmuramoyl-L-alanine amidase